MQSLIINMYIIDFLVSVLFAIELAKIVKWLFNKYPDFFFEED